MTYNLSLKEDKNKKYGEKRKKPLSNKFSKLLLKILHRQKHANSLNNNKF
jgi:hypothetical protein